MNNHDSIDAFLVTTIPINLHPDKSSKKQRMPPSFNALIFIINSESKLNLKPLSVFKHQIKF